MRGPTLCSKVMTGRTSSVNRRSTLAARGTSFRTTGQEVVTGDGTRSRGMPGRIPPNSGRRAVSPWGTGVTPLQPPSPPTGFWFISLFRFLFHANFYDFLKFLLTSVHPPLIYLVFVLFAVVW